MIIGKKKIANMEPSKENIATMIDQEIAKETCCDCCTLVPR